MASRRALQPCGTRAAYVRHKRHGEQPCSACTAANSRYSLDQYHLVTAVMRKLAKQQQGTWRQAADQLIARHADEFAFLWAQARRAQDGRRRG